MTLAHPRVNLVLVVVILVLEFKALRQRSLPSRSLPRFQDEARYKTFHMKIWNNDLNLLENDYVNKMQFEMNCFAPGLAFKQRLH